MIFCYLYLDIFSLCFICHIAILNSHRHKFPVDGSVHGDEHDEGEDGVEEEVEPHHVHLHQQLHTVLPGPRLTVM